MEKLKNGRMPGDEWEPFFIFIIYPEKGKKEKKQLILDIFNFQN
jgi:hypothetical protein